MSDIDFSGCPLHVKNMEGCLYKWRAGGYSQCRFCDIVPRERSLSIDITFSEYEIIKEAAMLDGIPMSKAGGLAVRAFIESARHGLAKGVRTRAMELKADLSEQDAA